MQNKRKKVSKKGFTLVEVLIALAVTALIMTAAAVAINASTISYQQNQNIFNNTNKARNALNRITTQIRTAYVDPSVMSSDQLKMLCQDGSNITYRYDSGSDILFLRDNTTTDEYVLCKGVTSLVFTKDDSTPTGDVQSVLITMTVENGSVSHTLSAAAVVRKILE